ncbi:hypothetical protein [Mesorhizobium sp. IMUNJ 23232]|uniref:hypothetical protein n=1 Tax=Mesorhizobium sp. IMUNJ 23232 TaxID=3376064 RepID=UPI003797E972
MSKLHRGFYDHPDAAYVGLASALVMLVTQNSTRVATNSLFLLGFTSMTFFFDGPFAQAGKVLRASH